MYNEIINGITGLDEAIMAKTSGGLDRLIKPIGSLGKLESLAIQIAGVTGKERNEINKKCIVIMSADNGIWESGVSPVPQNVTLMQTINFTKGICGINVLSKHSGADIKIVDIGVNGDISHPDILDRKIRKGTWNMSKGPAMTRDEAIKAVEVGIEIVRDLVAGGYDLIGTGEMGIGNTSTSSAILMALTGCSAEVAVGKGGGISEEYFQNKKKTIQKVIKINKPDSNDGLDVLAKVGGFDIAGLVGCYLGAAYFRVPIVIDGFISAAAALVAYKLNPISKQFMIASHESSEPGYKLLMDEIGINPMLNLNMRLGEGTGCTLAFNIIEASTKIVSQMATFEEAALEDDYLVDIR
jgi:nicotinate-nucleotide--dimethylbenzimidazole phosphoribosyltransferase